MTKMNERERLFCVLSGNEPDRAPCICPGGMMNMIITELMKESGIFWPEAHTDAEKMAGLALAVYEHQCFENYGVPFCMTIEAEELGAKVNLGTTVYEPHVTEYVIDSVSEFAKLPTINVHGGRAQVVLDAIAILRAKANGVPIIGNLCGPVSVASSLMEPVDYYKELRKNNAAAHQYMNFITKQLIAFGRAQVEAGADVIAVSDPSGTGEIMGPRFFEEFVVQYMNQLITGLKEGHEHVPVIVHICGQMNKVYQELQKINADAFSFDAVVSIKEAKQQMLQKIIMGNVSSFGLQFSDTNKVRSLTQKAIKDGADIIAPACGLGTQTSLANIQAMLATVKGMNANGSDS